MGCSGWGVLAWLALNVSVVIAWWRLPFAAGDLVYMGEDGRWLKCHEGQINASAIGVATSSGTVATVMKCRSELVVLNDATLGPVIFNAQ